MTRLDLYLTLILLLSHLSLSSAQLIGTLRQCDHDLIRATITNTHTHHVSVLKHNTIFDTSHQSAPFTITDANGIPLPVGSSHFFHTGVGRDDFLDLAPGGNFTRDLNLTQYVALGPKGSKHLQTIHILLSSAFQGLKDHNGVYDVHPAARGQLIDGQLRPGDVSKAYMTSISLTSVPFQIAISVPTRHSRIKARQNYPPGLQLAGDTCNPSDGAKALMGLQHAGLLALAGLNAATKFTELPFKYFFPGQIRTAEKVAAVMKGVIASIHGQGEPIQITCKDVVQHCRADIGKSRFSFINGYRITMPSVPPLIVICPSGLTFPPNPPPCSARPGALTIGYLVLHELVHVRSISGPRLQIEDHLGHRALDVGNAVKEGRDTTTEANAYAFLGSWAWDLGFGLDSPTKICLDRFSTGQFAANPFLPGGADFAGTRLGIPHHRPK